MSVNLKIFNREKVIKIKLKKLRVGTTEWVSENKVWGNFSFKWDVLVKLPTLILPNF